MRQASEQRDVGFPYADDRVPFILVVAETTEEQTHTKDARGFEHASTATKKRELLEYAQTLQGGGIECSVLAPWPGAKRTDVFLVDDLDEALEALG